MEFPVEYDKPSLQMIEGRELKFYRIINAPQRLRVYVCIYVCMHVCMCTERERERERERETTTKLSRLNYIFGSCLKKKGLLLKKSQTSMLLVVFFNGIYIISRKYKQITYITFRMRHQERKY
jgi:hypothetical protein